MTNQVSQYKVAEGGEYNQYINNGEKFNYRKFSIRSTRKAEKNRRQQNIENEGNKWGRIMYMLDKNTTKSVIILNISGSKFNN